MTPIKLALQLLNQDIRDEVVKAFDEFALYGKVAERKVRDVLGYMIDEQYPEAVYKPFFMVYIGVRCANANRH